MNNKIRPINTTPDPVIAAIEKMRRELPQIVENMALVAKIRMISYEAHIEAGFTAEQALVLCQK